MQIGDKRLSAHILHNLLGRIVCTLIFVVFKQILEDASKHLGINAYLSIVRIILVDGKVILAEELEEVCKEFAREDTECLVLLGTLEETAKERYTHGAKTIHLSVENFTSLVEGCIKTSEQRFKNVVKEVLLLVGRSISEELVHEVLRTVCPLLICCTQPALLLKKVEEDDTTKELLHIVANHLLVLMETIEEFAWRETFLIAPFTLSFTLVNIFLADDVTYKTTIAHLVLLEELPAQALYIESLHDVLQFYLTILAGKFLKIISSSTT